MSHGNSLGRPALLRAARPERLWSGVAPLAAAAAPLGRFGVRETYEGVLKKGTSNL